MTLKPIKEQRMAWALTGSGHYLRECIDIINRLQYVDLFLSKAAAEILKQYGYTHNVGRVYQDKTASSVPVELFYHGAYHTVVIAPATSNTVAKMVCGISDNLVTNIYAQAGKCRVPSISSCAGNACCDERVLHWYRYANSNLVYQPARSLRDSGVNK